MIEKIKMSMCMCCGDKNHRSWKCPNLHDVLNEGFYAGGNGGGSHDHDEEDSIPFAHTPYESSYQNPFSCVDQCKNEHISQFLQPSPYLGYRL